MPSTLRLADGYYMRRSDVQRMTHYLYAMNCVEVVGFSNVGKSALLRLLAQHDVWIQELGEAGSDVLPIYIDCNRMLEMTDQGFYELVLRCLKESSEKLADLSEVTTAYETLVSPGSEFQVPLSFDRGLTAILQSTERKLVFLFDEFDDPFSRIDGRVFLNLRALKDRYADQVAYIVATVEPMASRHQKVDERSEFCELFNHRTWYLAPLTRSDVDRLIRRYVDAFEVPFIAADFDFIYDWAGGHPSIVEGICRELEAVLVENGARSKENVTRWQLHNEVARRLRHNENLMYECSKIWEMNSTAERRALAALFRAGEEPEPSDLESLFRRHILLRIEGKPMVFSRLLSEFIQRQVMQEPPESANLWVNVDSGEVTVGGKPVEILTNLEYKLMYLLFQNVEKIVNKYQIVTNVWGEGYIDEVDDARIEKLVSRLRQKIEPDPGAPVFLTTVRGRGYRLLLH